MLAEIRTAAFGVTWAIRECALQKMLATTDTKSAVAVRRKLPKVNGAVAVLPVHGVISQRASIWQEIFGGTATESLGAAYQRAINDDRVKAIILDVDSPGGTVSGVQEVSQTIWDGAQKKPVAAIANSDMASAAYWIASQVGPSKKALAAAPGAEVGSVGVFRLHEDYSEALAMDGVKVSIMAVPKFKTEGNPFEPLTQEARDFHMGQIGITYDQFVGDVARGRGITKGAVKSGFGEGRAFDSSEAESRGMVDRVATLSQLLSELGVSQDGGLMQSESRSIEIDLCHAWEMGRQAFIEPVIIPSSEVLEKSLEANWKR